MGAVADVAAFTKVLRSASKIKEAVDVFDTGGVATFEKKILEISDLEEKVKDNLIKQARLKERITEVGKELLSTMNSGFNPKLFEYAFLSIKNGVISFDSFIKELKLASSSRKLDFHQRN